ncbi:MAG: trypsin-like peptidase domain-containing protein [Planctomycetota bacterium]
MLLSILFAFAPVQNLRPSADLDEQRKNRITPIVSVVQAARPAVVYIQTGATRRGRDIWGRIVAQEVSGAGSGVVIRKEGFIITNYHVIRNAERITVSFDKEFDDKEYNATVVSFVEEEDLALLKIQGSRPFPIIPLGRSGDLMMGETVVAVGNPYGQTITVTEGIISGLHRNVPVPQDRGRILEFPDLIQTDAAINPGNSGGPLVNLNGELIGISTAINAQAQNIGFAIPVDRVRSVLENQLLSPETAPAWLGFEIEPGDHLCVARVIPGSPAALAGLKPGDCIVAMAGEKVVNQDEYRAARLGLAPWSGTELQIDRQGAKKKIELQPWDRDVGLLYERLGIQVETRPARQGSWLYVTNIRPDGPAADMGLEPGDLIDALRPRLRGWRNLAVETREQLVNLLTSLPGGTQIDVEILRDLDKDSSYSPQEERLRGTITPE